MSKQDQKESIDMLAIRNNLMAEQASRQLGINYKNLTNSVQKLSSGLRINTAADDAAGMAVRELIRADVSVLRQGTRNGRDAISMLQTAEGAMGVIDSVLIRMRELAEQSATESYSSAQRGIMHDEFSQLVEEINRISNNTEFNGLNLLNLDSTDTTDQTDLKIHLGTSEMIQVDRADMTSTGLALTEANSVYQFDGLSGSSVTSATNVSGDFDIVLEGGTSYTVTATSNGQTISALAAAINSSVSASFDVETVTNKDGTVGIQLTAKSVGNDFNIASISAATGASAIETGSQLTEGAGNASIQSAASARLSLDTIVAAIKTKDQYRAKLGYLMNRLESATSVIDIQAENLLSAESRISDVDVASEMAAMTRHQVLAQAGISMLSQANSMPQMALSLLQG
ncbi:MAG: flagellin [Phycisphaerae bacterium]